MSGRRYRFAYESVRPSAADPFGQTTEWVKTLDELLVPNGTEPLLIWMLRELDARDGDFVLEPFTDWPAIASTHLTALRGDPPPPADPV